MPPPPRSYPKIEMHQGKELPTGGNLTMEADREAVRDLEDAILDEYAKALIRREAKMQGKRVDLSYKPIRAGSMPTLGECLKTYGNERVNMVRHQLDSKGFQALAESLMGNTTLRRVRAQPPLHTAPAHSFHGSARAWLMVFDGVRALAAG